MVDLLPLPHQFDGFTDKDRHATVGAGIAAMGSKMGMT